MPLQQRQSRTGKKNTALRGEGEGEPTKQNKTKQEKKEKRETFDELSQLPVQSVGGFFRSLLEQKGFRQRRKEKRKRKEKERKN
jgi:hypothetical protein